MTFEPLFTSTFVVQCHAFSAVLSLILGPIALLRRSRDWWHRVAGYLWVCAMAMTALSSFWISTIKVIGPFGPIHALSIYVLWSLWQGVSAARRGSLAAHREIMVSLYFWALCITGLITLLPGRVLNGVLLGGSAVLGIVVPVLGITFLLLTVYRKHVLPLGKFGDRH